MTAHQALQPLSVNTARNWILSGLVLIALIALTDFSVAQEVRPAVKVNQQTDAVRTVSQQISSEVPLVIAHRGASGYLPEHTTESAAFAHALSADYIEQDVVLTKDGVPVVLHDVTLDAVTNVADVFPDRAVDGKFYVFDFTLAEVQQLRVLERESSTRFPRQAGEFRISTLVEHIQLIQGLNKSRKRNAGLYVEIKKPTLHRERGLDSSKAVLKILADFGYSKREDRVFLQCFEESECQRLRTELKCGLPIIQLYSKVPTADQLAAAARVVDGIGVPLTAVVSGVNNGKPIITTTVQDARKLALLVHVWTLRDDRLPEFADNCDQMIDWLVKDGGVDGIFTDHPDTLVTWRARMQRQGKLDGPFHLLRDRVK